ncbi:MAG TPA: ABC transporter ATP-binding protein [Gemmataceae bacterium]|nr:ABC transporter ATP-binding protein [Gemmataceae bacterium]
MRPREAMNVHARGAVSLRRVGGLLHPYRWRLVLAFGLTALACLLNLALPLLLQRLIDGATAADSSAPLPAYAVGLLAAYATQAGATAGAVAVAGGVGLSVVRDLRRRLYAHLQELPLSYYDSTPTGAVISRVTDDVAAVQVVVGCSTLTAVTELGTALAVAGLLLWESPRLFLVAAAFLPAYLLNARVAGRRVGAGNTAVRERLDTIFAHLKEKLDGALQVRAAAQEPAEIATFAHRLAAAHAPRLHVARLGAAFAQLGTALGGVATAAVFAAACHETIVGRLSTGGAVAIVALAGMLFGPLGRATDLVAVFAQAAVSLGRVFAVLDLPIASDRNHSPLTTHHSPRSGPRIEFDRVAFGYTPGRPVVWDVRFTVEPGTKVALVGPTGCGKSTLLHLLLRFYEPNRGEIRLDGRPLGGIAPSVLRARIGVVPQETVVFRGTIADNIRYGAADADDERVRAAARAALVDDFVRNLPNGYDTVVGAGGHRLSQGECQRLAIARAVVKDPSVVLLDEATSALDPSGAALVQVALDNLLRGRTALIIAHRLTTVSTADRVVVMDGGLVEQIGTHAELLADREGLYRRLWESQFAAPPPRPTGNSGRHRRPEPIPA